MTRRPARIFITDQDDDTREIFGAVLRHEGYAVDDAPDAASTYPRLFADPPALLIVALEMPGPSGIAVLRRVREDPRTGTMKVIVVTSHVMADERESVEHAGFDAVIYRPVLPRAVVGVVHRLLRAA